MVRLDLEPGRICSGGDPVFLRDLIAQRSIPTSLAGKKKKIFSQSLHPAKLGAGER